MDEDFVSALVDAVKVIISNYALCCDSCCIVVFNIADKSDSF